MAKIFIITQKEITDTTGGAITSFKNIADFLCEDNEVYAICHARTKNIPKLNNNIKFINLYNKYDELPYKYALNQFIKEEKPDVIMFFFPDLYANSYLSNEFDEIPRILLFRSRPDFYFFVHKSTKHLKKQYKNTIAQVLFPSYIELLPKYIKKQRVVCIPNPTRTNSEYTPNKTEKKKIIYLSRIDCWKGHKFLIKSFALIAKKYPDWSLDIYGQSQPPELKENLKNLVKEMNLENQIHFCGVTKKPFETYLNYDFCVFPSYFEGFPLGLAESLSLGLPAIGFEGASGVNKLIIENKNGFLCKENYKDFASKMEILINNPNLRDEFSKFAIEQMKQYDNLTIKQSWNDLITDIVNKEAKYSEFKYFKTPKYKLFSLKKLAKIKKAHSLKKNKNINFAEKLFSVKIIKEENSTKKIIYILGLKFTIKLGGINE